jgi:hypothetical protein
MRLSKFLLTLAIVLVESGVVHSAPPPPGGGGGGTPSCWPPPCVPIDGGITLLIAAGAVLGIKKIHDARKKNPL